MKPVWESLAALALLVLVIGVLVLGIAWPAWDRLARADRQIVELEERLEAFHARAADRAGASIRVVSDRVLLPGPSPAMAAAAAQDVLAEAARRAGAELERVRIDDPVPMDGMLKIGLGVRVSAPIGTVADLIHGLESGVPYLVIEQLRIRRERGPGGAAMDRISAEFDMSGFAPPPPG